MFKIHFIAASLHLIKYVINGYQPKDVLSLT